MPRGAALDFRGTPVGIDVCKVVQTGITPAIDTGIAHREPGIGQVGAGLTSAPMECFLRALERAAELRGNRSASWPRPAQVEEFRLQ